jgi:hypothetical protein
MGRATVILQTPSDRARASTWIAKAPEGTRVDFKASKRTTPQNALMWALLSEVASTIQWHGMRLSAEDWKIVFLDALKRELRMVPNIDGTGFVQLGRSSSDLSKEEMAGMIDLIHAFLAKHGRKAA